jgi:hypothetical protein
MGDDDDEDERLANELASDPDMRELKKLFEEAACCIGMQALCI